MRMLDKYWEMIAGTEGTRDKFVPIDVSDAANFFIEQHDQEYWEYRRDFPCGLSPFSMAWYECSAPHRSNSNGTFIQLPRSITRHGWCVMVEEIDKGEAEEMLAGKRRVRHGMLDAFMEKAKNGEVASVRSDKDTNERMCLDGLLPRWEQMIISFIEIGGETCKQLTITFDLMCEQGKPITGSRRMIVSAKDLLIRDKVAEFGAAALLPLQFAISLLHCKNIVLEKDDVPEKVRRKREAKGQYGGARFRKIVIDPMKSIVKSKPGDKGEGIKNALASQTVRGHFAEYGIGPWGEKGKLFGKIEGRFWIPTHDRGSKDAGEIKHAYEVRRPKNATA